LATDNLKTMQVTSADVDISVRKIDIEIALPDVAASQPDDYCRFRATSE